MTKRLECRECVYVSTHTYEHMFLCKHKSPTIKLLRFICFVVVVVVVVASKINTRFIKNITQ